MRDTSYSATGSRVVRVTSGTGYQTTVAFSVYTTTTMKVHSIASVSIAWRVCGYSAQINSLPTYYMVGYSDMEEPTIGDYSAMLDEYVNQTLEPNLTSYTDNEIERLNRQSADWSKDITYKMGNLVQSTRSDLPLGLIRADGLNTDGETIYTPENYPDLYEAIVDGKIKSVDVVTFNNLIEANGWCGVFGLQTEKPETIVAQDVYYAYESVVYGFEENNWLLYFKNVEYPTEEQPLYTKTSDGSFVESGRLGKASYGDTTSELLIDINLGGSTAYEPEAGLRQTSFDETVDIVDAYRPACFYAPKITNVHQYGAIPTTDGANKHLGRTLIKSQEPTAENNYTWYNLYNDGWVEQGGRYSVSTSSAASAYTATEEITLPIEIEIGTGCGYVQAKHDCFNVGYSVDPRTCSTTVKLYYKNALGSAYTLSYMDWFLSGYAFESPEQLPVYHVVAYSDATEVTIGDYNAMLQEYKEETIKPDIYNYSESLKPGLQEYVDKAQEWATSDQVVDAANDLYSAKKYAERAADVAQCYYQPIKYVNLAANEATTVRLDTHPIVICQASGGDLDGGSTYTINLSLDVTTTEIDCWTYEVHLQVGDAIPTINWQTSDNKQIRWMAYSPKTPQLTNANAMFVFRNQGGILIGNYSGAY